jgi:hypothetical protein
MTRSDFQGSFAGGAVVFGREQHTLGAARHPFNIWQGVEGIIPDFPKSGMVAARVGVQGLEGTRRCFSQLWEYGAAFFQALENGVDGIKSRRCKRKNRR